MNGIRLAGMEHLDWLADHDAHISRDVLEESIRLRRVLVACRDGKLLGWLRWNLFWDNTPFMNLLFVPEECRGQGVGQALVRFWEAEMRRLGHALVMTSTQANECAQFFYRKLGYEDAGGFCLPGDSYELILCKKI